MNFSPTFLLAGFGAVNALAFFIMWWDKRQSRKTGVERISEGYMFFMSIAFGSLGIFLGMFAFRHKTAKWHFLLGIPLAFLQNMTFLFWLKENIFGAAGY